MDESNYYSYFMNGRHIPAFGSWDCHDDFPIPFTQCFESARQQAGFLRYSYSEDRDLYVAGDLYQNDIVTPAMIVVPCRKRRAVGKEEGWVVCNSEYEYEYDKDTVKEAPSPVPPAIRMTSKAVDEDLYKISPALLSYSNKPKRKGLRGLISSCLRPTCVS